MNISYKKISRCVLALIFGFSMLNPALNVQAEEIDNSTGIKYSVKDGKATAVGHKIERRFLNTDLIIPQELGGAPVVAIGDNAYIDYVFVTAVEIPDSVTSIGNSALASMGIKKINIPKNVSSIGEAAFSGCSFMKEVNFSKEIKALDIGQGAFSNCVALTTITLPNSVTSIKSSTFNTCRNLQAVNLTDSIKSIGDSAFMDCSILNSIDLSNVTSIGESAFFRSGLKNVKLSDKLTLIDYSVFEECQELTSILIPAKVTAIKDRAFQDSGLTSVEIPASVKEIGRDAFMNCKSLRSITIKSKNTLVNEYSLGYYYDNGGNEKLLEGVTIYAPKDSIAETYAKANNIKFQTIAEEKNTEQGNKNELKIEENTKKNVDTNRLPIPTNLEWGKEIPKTISFSSVEGCSMYHICLYKDNNLYYEENREIQNNDIRNGKITLFYNDIIRDKGVYTFSTAALGNGTLHDSETSERSLAWTYGESVPKKVADKGLKISPIPIIGIAVMVLSFGGFFMFIKNKNKH